MTDQDEARRRALEAVETLEFFLRKDGHEDGAYAFDLTKHIRSALQTAPVGGDDWRKTRGILKPFIEDSALSSPPADEKLREAVRDLNSDLSLYVQSEEGPFMKSDAQVKHAETIAACGENT